MTEVRSAIELAPPSGRAERSVMVLAVTAAVLVLGPLGARAQDAYTLPKELAFHALALAAVVMMLLRGRPLRLGAPEALIGALVVVTASSAAVAVNPWAALRGLALTVSAAIVFLYARNASAPGRRLLVAAAAIAVTAACLAVVVEAAGGFELSIPGRAPGGLGGNRNYAAHLAVLGLPIVGVGLVAARSRPGVALAAASLAICAGALVLTRCRGAWLGALVLLGLGLAWMACRRSRQVRRRGGFALVAIALGVAAAVSVPTALKWNDASPYATTFVDLAAYDRGSGRGRLIQYGRTLELVRAHPALGVGAGNWRLVYPLGARKDDPNVSWLSPEPVNRLPNSDWLALLAERGLVAATLVLALGAWLLLELWRRRRDAPLQVATAAGVAIGVAITGTFDAVLHRPEPALVAALVLGAVMPPRVERPLGPRPRRLLLSLAAILAALACVDGLRRYAVHHLGEGDVADRELAIRLDPGDSQLRCGMAISAYEIGDCGRARSLARAAIARNPGLMRCRAVERTCVEGQSRVAPSR